MATKSAPQPRYGASVRPRPRRDGTTAFDVRYRLDGASRTISFNTQPAADKWAGIVRKIGPAQAIEFLNISTTPGTPTLEEYLETYIATKSGIEPRTIQHYRAFMRLHIGPALGHLPLDGVSKTTVAGWINQMRDDGASAKSIKNRHGFLSAMMQNAVDDGVIPSNPCAKSTLPKSERVEMVFLSPDEFTSLLGYIPPRHQPLVQLLAATGMRWGEVTALRPGDFDLTAGTVRISRAWKAGGPDGWYIGPPKTSRSKRTIELPPNMIEILRPQIGPTEYVFTNQRGGPIRQQNFFEGVWSPARRLANGLPAYAHAKVDLERPWIAKAHSTWDAVQPATVPLGKSPRVHDLRHSHVAWLLARGVGIDVVSRRLGHESIKTTADIYGHVAPERLWDAAHQIGVALSGAITSLENDGS